MYYNFTLIAKYFFNYSLSIAILSFHYKPGNFCKLVTFRNIIVISALSHANSVSLSTRFVIKLRNVTGFPAVTVSARLPLHCFNLFFSLAPFVSSSASKRDMTLNFVRVRSLSLWVVETHEKEQQGRVNLRDLTRQVFNKSPTREIRSQLCRKLCLSIVDTTSILALWILPVQIVFQSTLFSISLYCPVYFRYWLRSRRVIRTEELNKWKVMCLHVLYSIGVFEIF